MSDEREEPKISPEVARETCDELRKRPHYIDVPGPHGTRVRGLCWPGRLLTDEQMRKLTE